MDMKARWASAMLLCVSCVDPHSLAAGETPMTALDRAYQAANNDSGKQSEYYDLFLNSEIFIPTHNVPSENRRRRAGDNETISPIFGNSEGKSYLMLFESKERLSAWANRQVGFVALPGHVVVEIMSSDIHWILNAGTKHAKIFVPDEIKWLKKTMARNKQEILPRDTTVYVGAPAKVPPGLVDSLTKRLEPISKLLEQHGDGGELYKAQEIRGVVFPANQ
jgi:hypothetical protein